MTFELFCTSLLALLIGMAVAFNGYRWFLILLPIWGFFAGFGLGAQTVQALFGIGFISTATSWVVGFIAGLIFAVLSYLFYMVGVALFAGSFGYALGVGLMGLFGLNLGLISWLVGMVLAIIVAIGTLALNLQKWAIIFITAFGGATIIIGTILFAFGVITPADLGTNPVRAVIDNSFWWTLFYLALGIVGFLSQVATTRTYVLTAPEARI